MNIKDINIGDTVNINGSMFKARVVGFAKCAGDDMVKLRRIHYVTGALERGTPLTLPPCGLSRG
jgi:hypothetical protein